MFVVYKGCVFLYGVYEHELFLKEVPTMNNGTVIWFNAENGYGFISND